MQDKHILVTAPGDLVHEHADRVLHEAHRQHLHSTLGHIAERTAYIPELDMQDNEALAELYPLASYQTKLAAGHFRAASQEAGPSASIEDVWECVAANQLEALKGDLDANTRETLATNFLVTNLLSTHSESPDYAKELLDHRMWQAAKTGQGHAILEAASKNIGLCASTGWEDSPYVSIIEQTRPFTNLLTATDISVDAHTVAMPIPELEAASINNQAWLLGHFAKNGNTAAIDTNSQFIKNKQDVLMYMAVDGKLNPEILTASKLGEIMDSEHIVSALIDKGFTPEFSNLLPSLDREAQTRIFNQLLAKNPDSVPGALFSPTGFSNLDSSALETLIESGLLSDTYYTIPLTAFNEIKPGIMEKLLPMVSPEVICDMMPNFPLEEQREFVKKYANNFAYADFIFANPDKFPYTKDEFLKIAMDACKDTFFPAETVALARHLELYTDGSDEELLANLVNRRYAGYISHRIDKFPALDREWFLTAIRENGDVQAIVDYAAQDPSVDQWSLFEDILNSEHAYALKVYLDGFKQLDSAAAFKALLDREQFGIIAYNLPLFKEYMTKEIFDTYGDNPQALEAFAPLIRWFDFIDIPAYTRQLAKYNNPYSIALNADTAIRAGVPATEMFEYIKNDGFSINAAIKQAEFCHSIGRETLLNRLFDLEDVYNISDSIKRTDSNDIKDRFFDLCYKKNEAYGLAKGATNAQMDPFRIIEKSCKYHFDLAGVAILKFEDVISPSDMPTQQQLQEWGGAGIVLAFPDTYQDADKTQLYAELVTENNLPMIEFLLGEEATNAVPRLVADYLIESGHATMLYESRKRFDKSIFTQELIEHYLSHADTKFTDLYEYSGVHIDWIDKAIRIFGKDILPSAALTVRDLGDDSANTEVPTYLQELGITEHGQSGIEQLRSAQNELRRKIVFGAENAEEESNLVKLITSNKLARSITKQLTRFTESQWGRHDEDGFTATLHNYLQSQPEIKPLEPGFIPSQEYQIRSIDSKEFNPDKLDVDAKERYEVLQRSLQYGIELAERPARQRFAPLFDQANSLLDAEHTRLAGIREQLAAKKQDKALFNIDRQIKQIDSLRQMDLRSFVNFMQHDFQGITSFNIKGFDHIIRAGAYARAIKRSPEGRALAMAIRNEPATLDSLVAMDDFIEHIVNNETFGHYFKTKPARQAFRRLTDTTALRQQITKLQSGQSAGATTLQFVPSRGPMLELSGHIADACWASKYDSIGKVFPNITAVGYLRNPGKATERLVGAGLLIDTVDEETNEPVLVLRGTNPIENYINGVKVEDFFTALLDYVKQIAGDRKIAVVIDGGPSNAATNRPVVYNYLKNQVMPTVKPTPLPLPDNTTFNGYELKPTGANPHPVYELNLT